jgi:DNA repair protein RadA/Sms
LRAAKHRFGATGELGIFEMGDVGLVGVPDGSGMFLGDRQPGASGSVVVATMEGHRPLLVEVQALVNHTNMTMPRRAAQGVDSGRMALILAVLERHARLKFGDQEVFASAVGGGRLVEPGADLGIAIALASARNNTPVPAGLVACGELGLGGELRQVAQTPRRLAEAARLGFTEAAVPASAPDGPPGLRLHRMKSVRDAVALLARQG